MAGLLRIDRAAIVEAQWVDNGPGWIAVMLASGTEVLAVDHSRYHHGPIDIGIVGPHPAGGPAAFEISAIFSDAHGALIEDPVCGSLNASVGQWLFEPDARPSTTRQRRALASVATGACN